jgi:hypothetical protein
MAFNKVRTAAAGLAILLSVGAVSAQAAPAASAAAPAIAQAGQAQADSNLTDVRYRGGYRHGYRHRGYRNGAIGAGIALGTLGLIAGASAYDRGYYRCDPYYDDCYPRRRVYGYYDTPRYYAPPPRAYYYGY